MNTTLLSVLSARAKDRRIAQGRDTETNLTIKLGRKPTHEEMLAAVQAELDEMFPRIAAARIEAQKESK